MALDAALPYNPDEPLRPEIERTEEELHISISWLRYTGIKKRRVTSILIEPSGDGPYSGVIFLQDTKVRFLNEGKMLAADGFVSLLIDAPANRPAPYTVEPDPSDAKSVRADCLQTIGDVRRGFDVLEQLEAVDSSQLGYVGRHYGANLAAAVAALEPRAKAVVSVAGMPRQSAFWLSSSHPLALERRKVLGGKRLRRVADALAEFDLIAVIEQAPAIGWLFQFGTLDTAIPAQDIEDLRRVAPADARFAHYPDDHAMESLEAEADRKAWLQEQLL